MNDEARPSLAQLQAMLADCPFHRLFALSVLSADAEAGQVVLRMALTPAVERAPGSGQFHGGAIASLIDIAGDFALIAELGHGVPTINLRTDFLRPAINTGLNARATARRIGRTIAVVDIDVVDDEGRLVAIGRGCYASRAG